MAVKTINLVRKIRDQLNEEMKGLSVRQQRAYIHQKAAEARKKISRMRPSRKVKPTPA